MKKKILAIVTAVLLLLCVVPWRCMTMTAVATSVHTHEPDYSSGYNSDESGHWYGCRVTGEAL